MWRWMPVDFVVVVAQSQLATDGKISCALSYSVYTDFLGICKSK